MPRTQLLHGEHLACYLIRTLQIPYSVGRIMWKQFSQAWRNERMLEHFKRAILHIATEHALINPPIDEQGAGDQYFAELHEDAVSCGLSFWARQPGIAARTPALLHNYSFTRVAPDSWPHSETRTACYALPYRSPISEQKRYELSLRARSAGTILDDIGHLAIWLQILNGLCMLLAREGWSQCGSKNRDISRLQFRWKSDPIAIEVDDYRMVCFYETDPSDPAVTVQLRLIYDSGGILMSLQQHAPNNANIYSLQRENCVLPKPIDFRRTVEFFVLFLSPRKRGNRKRYLRHAMNTFAANTPGTTWRKRFDLTD